MNDRSGANSKFDNLNNSIKLQLTSLQATSTEVVTLLKSGKINNLVGLIKYFQQETLTEINNRSQQRHLNNLRKKHQKLQEKIAGGKLQAVKMYQLDTNQPKRHTLKNNLDIENIKGLSRDTSNGNINRLSVRDESVDLDAKSQASRDTQKTKGSSNRNPRKTIIMPQVPKLLGG